MRLLIAAAGLLLCGNAQALDSLEEVRTCVQGNVPNKAVRQDLALIHQNRAGRERQMIGRLFVERSDEDLLQMVMKLQQPKALFGAAYLYLQGSGRLPDKLLGKADDRTYVYLPAARQSRKVDSGSVGSELFGTNVSTDDLKHLFGTVSGGQVQYHGEKRSSAGRAYAMTLTPYEKTSPYAKIEALIDARTCLTAETRFFAANGQLEKTLSQDLSKVTRVDGRFVGHHYTMREAGSAENTQLILGNVHYDKDLPDTLFHPDGYYR